MENTNFDKPEEIISISSREANSPHVDDLLKRQMSLRGDTGITQNRKRSWFYQNWFVFMITAMIAAIAAWALMEPFFNDLPYLQGTITQVNPDISMPSQMMYGQMVLDLKIPILGSIKIGDQEVLLLESAEEILPDKTQIKLDRSRLETGREAGVYVEYVEGNGVSIALCSFIDLSPGPQSPRRASMKLSQISAEGSAASLLLLPLVAGFIGLAIGTIDGIICRTVRRALLCGGAGLLIGLLGGFISSFIAGLVYMPLNQLAMAQMGDSIHSISPFGFLIQTTGRGLAWCLAGMAMGLGQGIALRSKRLLLYGFLGGIIGGLLGGLLFDPIDFLLLGVNKPSAHWSRLIGLATIGIGVGAMIGVVELLARDAWLQMIKGPLTGKEFLIFKDRMIVGSSPRSDIYLFNDPLVAQMHARISTTGDIFEIQNLDSGNPALLNGRPVKQSRLRNGDRISIGQTEFLFQTRKH